MQFKNVENSTNIQLTEHANFKLQKWLHAIYVRGSVHHESVFY
jgi:hypothetical protein